MPDYEAMFKLMWAERNAMLSILGCTTLKTPGNLPDLVFVLDNYPLLPVFVPRKDFEAVLKAVAPPPKDTPCQQ